MVSMSIRSGRRAEPAGRIEDQSPREQLEDRLLEHVGIELES